MSYWKSYTKILFFEILGLVVEGTKSSDDISNLMHLIIELRAMAKENKDYATSDKIRNELEKMNYQIKDGKDGTIWNKS